MANIFYISNLIALVTGRVAKSQWLNMHSENPGLTFVTEASLSPVAWLSVTLGSTILDEGATFYFTPLKRTRTFPGN
jgi:hypothetical protein